MDTYYVKRKDIWSMNIPPGLSWMFKKILGSRDVLGDYAGAQAFVHQGQFVISKLYKRDFAPVLWKRLLCNNNASPKSIFILAIISESLCSSDNPDS